MFDKYKDIHLNESAYLLGSGPTIKDFPVEEHPGLYIGVNDVHFLPHIKDKLNYLVTEKYFPEIELISNDVKLFCWDTCKPRRSYFGYKPHIGEMSDIYSGTTLEIWKRFNECGSVIFHGFFLAIHLGCKKIYLVGCDCTENRAMVTSKNKPNKIYKYKKLVPGWKAIKEYAKEHHPDVEIININPVNLKDMFPSIYTISDTSSC